jgi:hypothetical protein
LRGEPAADIADVVVQPGGLMDDHYARNGPVPSERARYELPSDSVLMILFFVKVQHAGKTLLSWSLIAQIISIDKHTSQSVHDEQMLE